MAAKAIPKTSLSVFDRLLDAEPEKQTEDQPTASQRFARVKESVRRDLEVLLNTQHQQARYQELDEDLSNSVVSFGTPGFNGMMLATQEQKLHLARMIGELIITFETRLRKVRVELAHFEDEDRRMHLRILGSLDFEDQLHPITFDTHLDPSIRRFRIAAASKA